jgi:hypothetical protein
MQRQQMQQQKSMMMILLMNTMGETGVKDPSAVSPSKYNGESIPSTLIQHNALSQSNP